MEVVEGTNDVPHKISPEFMDGEFIMKEPPHARPAYLVDHIAFKKSINASYCLGLEVPARLKFPTTSLTSTREGKLPVRWTSIDGRATPTSNADDPLLLHG